MDTIHYQLGGRGLVSLEELEVEAGLAVVQAEVGQAGAQGVGVLGHAGVRGRGGWSGVAGRGMMEGMGDWRQAVVDSTCRDNGAEATLTEQSHDRSESKAKERKIAVTVPWRRRLGGHPGRRDGDGDNPAA